jgi:hypothetical protein
MFYKSIPILLFCAVLGCNPQIPVVYGEPLIITKGGVYRGNWQSSDPNVAAVDIRTSEAVTIENSQIRSAGTGIRSFHPNANVTVRKTKAIAIAPSQARAKKDTFADFALFTSVTVERNEISGYATGLRFLNYGEDVTRSGQVVRVRYNRFSNMDGRMSDGQGGYLKEHQAGGQAIGLNSVRQADVEIAWNEIINLPYQSQTEDVISTYESGGTAQKPILIHNNYIQGNYAADPAAALEFSGVGINLGDSPSAHPDVGYTDAYNNQVVSFQNAGIGISAGHHQRVWNNRLVSASSAPDGTLLGSVWRAAYGFWNYYQSPHWANNTLYNNVYAVAQNNQRKDSYTPDATPQSVYNNLELFDRPATRQDEIVEWQLWQQKLQSANILIGLP